MVGARLGACLLLLLGGCQAPSEGWTKPGASAADRTRDLADCARVATGPPPFHFWALGYDYADARDRIARLKSGCMVARGWRRD